LSGADGEGRDVEWHERAGEELTQQQARGRASARPHDANPRPLAAQCKSEEQRRTWGVPPGGDELDLSRAQPPGENRDVGRRLGRPPGTRIRDDFGVCTRPGPPHLLGLGDRSAAPSPSGQDDRARVPATVDGPIQAGAADGMELA